MHFNHTLLVFQLKCLICDGTSFGYVCFLCSLCSFDVACKFMSFMM